MDPVLYFEHFTDTDISLLSQMAGMASPTDWIASVRSRPELLDMQLASEAIHATLFGSGEDAALLRASPFLIFAVLVHRAARDLTQVPFVQEWVGPDRRVPMFEVNNLRDFAAIGAHRLFLAELLASYTRVASGAIWMRSARGWRRHRYSELDPVRLIEMLDIVPDSERPALYRRLGDLSLFLTGVFPDYAGASMLPRSQRRRLENAMAWQGETGHGPMPGDMMLFEQLGRRAYHMAQRSTTGDASTLLAEVSDGFGNARRTLNFVTDRYLFPFRERWFPVGGA